MGNLDPNIAWFFRRPTSVTFIKGRKDWGKTDFAFRILEDALNDGYVKKIGSNCKTFDDPRVDFIMYYDRLEQWLEAPGKKAFLLDELGKSLYRMAFMSKQAKVILDVCQLSRKYKCHLIGVAPTAKFVNRLFFSDILDCFIEKLGKTKCRLKNIITNKVAIIRDIPRTTLKFDTYYISDFQLSDPVKIQEEFLKRPTYEKAAILYLKHRSLRKVANILQVSHTQVANYLNTYLHKHFTHVKV